MEINLNIFKKLPVEVVNDFGKESSESVQKKRTVGSLVVRASDSGPEGPEMNQTCFQNVEEWSETNITGDNSFQCDEAHFWLNGYVNKQNCRIWSEANPQVYVETPLHPEKLTVWCALWAGGILLQKR
ncbi:hypothetical protein TNCV_4039511 [Trichonephila clavipes]|nr:hypothetical protein TNCV_4039511 [Trichonephila clavipes]